MTLNMRVPALGLSFLLERMGADCAPLQYLREIVQNSIDSFLRNGLSGEITVDADPVYLSGDCRKLCIVDNAGGMDPDELVNYINALSVSGGIQAKNANYGIGAKIAGGLANPAGMIYQSWKNGKGYMIQFWKDPETGMYGLRDLTDDPTSPWLVEMDDSDKPPQIDKHGTKVILLGTCDTDDTTIVSDVLPAGVERKKWVPFYLNNRYFKFPPNVTIRTFPNDSWARVVKGMQHHLDEKSEAKGKFQMVDVNIHWWILRKDTTGKKNARGDACIETSHVAALYQNELYGLRAGNAGKALLNQFGIIYGSKRVVLYAEPTDHAVTTDTARSNLKIDGQELPWEDWGAFFRANMPQEILDLEESEASITSSVANIDDIKRLLSNVMEYFKFSSLKPDKKGVVPANIDPNGSNGIGKSSSKPHEPPDPSDRDRLPRRSRVKPDSNPYVKNKNGTESVSETSVEVAIPKITWETIPDTDLIGYAARYHPTGNILRCNSQFIGFIELHRKLVAERKLSGGLAITCRDAIEKWYAVSLAEAVVGIQCASTQLGWDSNKIQQALSPEALTTVCMQKHSQVSNIKRELGSKLGAQC